ncbi:MAG: lysylphosphatidylglycerol synthase transmembrane domain-containing protein [Bacteroidota bacterium]
MNKQALNILKYVGGVGLGGLLLYLSFKDASLETITNNLRSANPFWIVASVCIGAFSHYLRALRWQMQFKASGYHPPAARVFSSVMLMYLVNNALPRVGEIARCTALLRSDKIPIATSMGTVIVERLFDMLVLLLLIIVAFVLESATIYGYIEKALSGMSATSAGMTILGVAGVGLLLVVVLFYVFRKKIMASTAFQKATAFVKNLWSSAISIKHIEKPGLFIVYTFIIWFCYWMMTYVIFLSIPALQQLDISFIYFSLIVTIIGAFGYALPVPGGIGPYHAAVTFTFVAFQVHPEAAVSADLGRSFAIIIHSAHLLLQILGGAIAYFYLLSQKPEDSAVPAY